MVFANCANGFRALSTVLSLLICLAIALECNAQAPGQNNPYRQVETRPAGAAPPASRVATRLPPQTGAHLPANAANPGYAPQAALQQTAAPSQTASATAAHEHQDRIAAVILVKNALVAVNQGNLTGNFTVLRDLSSPGFRDKNSAGDLAVIFNTIRQQKLDLSPVVVMDPVMGPPRKTEDGQILLEGYFPSQPLRINYQLLFQKAEHGSGWMINGVAISAAPMNSVSSNSAAAPNPNERASAPINR